MREVTTILLNEIVELRARVYGADKAYTDELAHLLGIDTDKQRANETDDQYKERLARVASRRNRLSVTEK